MKKCIPWLACVAGLVVIFGTIYVTVQQSQRSDANYPQIQMAEDGAAALNQGVLPVKLTSGRVDVGSSLAPFIIIYDRSGQVVGGSGYLNGSIPVAPDGVLTAADNQTYHSVTWQPQSGVRIASVTVKANSYYVLSGRSLQEVEKNEDRTLRLNLAGGGLSLVVLLVAFVLMKFRTNRSASKLGK